MFRIGIVTAQDITKARVRVRFPDRDHMTSWWLAIVVPKSQNDKHYWMPDLGESVVCVMDEKDEAGAVLGAIYSSADATPVQNADKWHVTIKDGASFEYDRAAHALAVALPAGAAMTISANGATIAIDASGNISLISPVMIKVQAPTVQVDGTSSVVLAGGGPAVARVGDATTCPAGAGSITSGSGKTNSG